MLSNKRNTFLRLVFLPIIILLFSCSKLGTDVNDKPVNTRSCVNLIDQNALLFDKSIDSNGDVINDNRSESVVTDFISVFNGDQWYQKVIYLHTCSQRDLTYGFHSDLVSFYDGNKVHIKQLKNIIAPILIPPNARYARVQFRSTDKLLFASITNRTILSPYTEYDRIKLVNNPEKLYLGVHNSEGSISQFLRTGYDYLERGLGFGSLHTAFNTNCIKVEAYNDYYTGEKWQVDCSSFVELALTGVKYNNSRYVRGNEADNIANEKSFRFDDNTEYNYLMLQFPDECGADHGRLYANKIAKYFYDRGFLYEVESDFSNVGIGDLLFWGKGNLDSDFFYGIGHVAICSDKWKKRDGGYGLRVLETAYESVKEYSDGIRFGARPLLPNVENDKTELIKDISNSSCFVSLSAGEKKLISTVTLLEDLQLRELYTVLIDCEIPNGTRLVLKNSLDKDALGCDDEFEYSVFNGIIVKHFGVKTNMLGKNKNIFGIYVCASNSINGEVRIKRVSVRKGFHLEESFNNT